MTRKQINASDLPLGKEPSVPPSGKSTWEIATACAAAEKEKEEKKEKGDKKAK